MKYEVNFRVILKQKQNLIYDTLKRLTLFYRKIAIASSRIKRKFGKNFPKY